MRVRSNHTCIRVQCVRPWSRVLKPTDWIRTQRTKHACTRSVCTCLVSTLSAGNGQGVKHERERERERENAHVREEDEKEEEEGGHCIPRATHNRMPTTHLSPCSCRASPQGSHDLGRIHETAVQHYHGVVGEHYRCAVKRAKPTRQHSPGRWVSTRRPVCCLEGAKAGVRLRELRTRTSSSIAHKSTLSSSPRRRMYTICAKGGRQVGV